MHKGRSSNHLALYRARANFEIKFSNGSNFNSSHIQLDKEYSESSEHSKSSFNHQVPTNSPDFVKTQMEYGEDEFDEFQVNSKFLRMPEKSSVRNADRDSPVSRDCLLNNENESNSEEIIEDQTLKISSAQRTMSLKSPSRKPKNENDDTFLSKSLSSKVKLNNSRSNLNSESLNI